jgi:hypothetical protein
VRLGPSTPGDYVRARVLVPRNPGVTERRRAGRMEGGRRWWRVGRRRWPGTWEGDDGLSQNEYEWVVLC